MLSQHNLQVDLLPPGDLITGGQAARSSTPMIETTDLLIQLGHPSGVIQYSIGKPRHTTLSIFMEMKCLGCMSKQ